MQYFWAYAGLQQEVSGFMEFVSSLLFPCVSDFFLLHSAVANHCRQEACATAFNSNQALTTTAFG